MHSVLERYNQAVAKGDIVDNPLQRQLLAPLETLSNNLDACKNTSWFSWLKKPAPIMGAYLYGPVGVGKTFLMDLFYESITTSQKMRFHFHQFMKEIDSQLRLVQGHKNPLQRIADTIKKSAQLLCFDEMMVHDVAHAMILAELIDALVSRGVVLVITSNVHPDDLYLQGVHRERFLPAIALLKSHCHVLNLDEKTDYRLGRNPDVNNYLVPLDSITEASLKQQFETLAPIHHTRGALNIQGRDIPCIKWSERLAWFDFKVLCNTPRSQLDYLEIANRFDTIFISDIPRLSEKDTLFAILFVHLIDVMYDQGMHLILSAEVPIDELYQQGEMLQEFKRAASRLQEMQSMDYINRHPHRILTPTIF